MISASVINETSNLKLYRNRDFAFQKELHSVLRLRRREVNFGERMFLFCGPVNPPGTSSCDKAQVLLLPDLKGVTNLSPATRTEEHDSAHAQRRQLRAGLRAASLEALWNLTVLCYGLRILS